LVVIHCCTTSGWEGTRPPRFACRRAGESGVRHWARLKTTERVGAGADGCEIGRWACLCWASRSYCSAGLGGGFAVLGFGCDCRKGPSWINDRARGVALGAHAPVRPTPATSTQSPWADQPNQVHLVSSAHLHPTRNYPIGLAQLSSCANDDSDARAHVAGRLEPPNAHAQG